MNDDHFIQFGNGIRQMSQGSKQLEGNGQPKVIKIGDDLVGKCCTLIVSFKLDTMRIYQVKQASKHIP